MSSNRLPTFMIPHGGGPCFFMDPPAGQPTAWDAMAAHLRSIDGQVGRRPKAVLVVSAHWECEVPTVHTGTNPSLLFDYYGFPEHTYRLAYPVQGSPEVAARVALLLEGASIPTATESKRGLDHGVFVPFKLIYPDADVPIVQLSLRVGLSPQEHLEIGRALAPLRDEDVLIVGSGMTSHAARRPIRTGIPTAPLARTVDQHRYCGPDRHPPRQAPPSAEADALHADATCARPVLLPSLRGLSSVHHDVRAARHH